MPFPIHTLETAPAGARETLDRLTRNYGFLPNLAGVVAESPATLNGLFGFMGAYDAKEMTLTPLERQIVLLAVSTKNKCEYCTAAHSMLAQVNGLDGTDVVHLQQGRPLGDTRLEALRRFAETVVEKRGWVGESEVGTFIAAGFTRAQVFEVVFGVALKTLTNYINHIAKPPVNEQFAAFVPTWADAA
jgi:uncharacterized peroxidase-related enzyme